WRCGLRSPCQWLVVSQACAVVAAGRHGELSALSVYGQLQQPYMQVAAGVQRDGCVLGTQGLRGICGEHVLALVKGGDAEPRTQAGAVLDQRRVPFQAGQCSALAGQLATEVTLARAPVQPVARFLTELQAGGERLDL